MKKISTEIKDWLESWVFAGVYASVTCRLYIIILIALFAFFCGMFTMSLGNSKDEQQTIPPVETTTVSHVEYTEEITIEDLFGLTETAITTTEETSEPETDILSQDEIELLALLTMAEAEGESEEGKRLVIDTVLNRVDSDHFPDTVTGVIYQANQFSPMWDGRIDRCYVTEEMCQLVREELNNRTNYDVVFFRTDHYSEYGQPLFQVGNHYFSSYE